MGATAVAVAEFFGANAATAATAVAAGAGAKAVNSLLSPKSAPQAPQVPKVTPMPDPLAQEEAQRRKTIEQLARRGRTASVLTTPSGGADTLGG